MTKADLDLALLDVHQRSVAAYLRRQQIQQNAMLIQQQATMCDQELLRLDGEEAALLKLREKATD